MTRRIDFHTYCMSDTWRLDSFSGTSSFSVVRVLEMEVGRTYNLAVVMEDSLGNPVRPEDSDATLEVVLVGQDGLSFRPSYLDPRRKRQVILPHLGAF